MDGERKYLYGLMFHFFRCQGCSLTSFTCWYDDECISWWFNKKPDSAYSLQQLAATYGIWVRMWVVKGLPFKGMWLLWTIFDLGHRSVSSKKLDSWNSRPLIFAEPTFLHQVCNKSRFKIHLKLRSTIGIEIKQVSGISMTITMLLVSFFD